MQTQALKNLIENNSIVELVKKLSKSLSGEKYCKLKIKDLLWRALVFDSHYRTYSKSEHDFIQKNKIFHYLLQFKHETNSDYVSDRLEYLINELENLTEYGEQIIEFLFEVKKYKLNGSLSHQNDVDCIQFEKSFFFARSKIDNEDFKFQIAELNLYTGMSGLTDVDLNDNFLLPNLKLFSEFNLDRPFEQLHPFDFVHNEAKRNVDSRNATVQNACENTLFFSMVSKSIGKHETNNVSLELPELPVDMSTYKWQLPTQDNYEWIDYDRLLDLNRKQPYQNLVNDDQGFFSKTTSTITSCYITDNQTQFEMNDVWDRALNEQASNYYDWESVGNSEYALSEDSNERIERICMLNAPKHIFDEFYYDYLQNISTLSNLHITRLLIPDYNFMLDCLMVLIGCSSYTFYFDKNKFIADDKIQISGISSEALNSFCQEFACAGTTQRSLLKLVESSSEDLTSGSVFRAFTNALREYLKYYHSLIISQIDENLSDLTPIKMFARLKPVMDQLKGVGEICMINESEETLPKGIQLIFHLFVESWIYHGQFNDKFNEFIIDIDNNSIARRDVIYWTHAYKLKNDFKNKDQEHYELFNELYEKIYTCGKTIALMRVCKQNHFLCSNSKDFIRLKANFNMSYLNEIPSLVLDYKKRVMTENKINFQTRLEHLEKKRDEQQELYVQAQIENEKRTEEIRKKKENESRALAQRKQRDLDRLRDDIEREADRRKIEKLREKRENQEYTQKVTKREFELIDSDNNLKEQIKKEMVGEYEKLMQDAERREEAAKARMNQAKTQIKMIEGSHSSNETQNDNDQKRIDYFKAKNYQGHSSDSTIQNIIYQEQNESFEQMNVSIPMDVDMFESPEVKARITTHPSIESNQKEIDNELIHKFTLFKSKNNHSHVSDSTLQNLRYGQSITETDHQSLEKSHIDTLLSNFSTNESFQANENAKIDAFKRKNTHGHSSDSQIQNLMYYETKNVCITTSSPKTFVKLIVESHVSDETSDDKIDEEVNKKIDTFKHRNTHGHASNSSIQNLLYSNDTPVKAIQSINSQDNNKPKINVYHGHTSDSTVQNLIHNEKQESLPIKAREVLNEKIDQQFEQNKLERERNKYKNEYADNSSLLIAHRNLIRMNPNQNATKSSLSNNFGMNTYEDEENQAEKMKLKFLENQTYDWNEIYKDVITKYDDNFDFTGLKTNLLNEKNLKIVQENAKLDTIIDLEDELEELLNENQENLPEIFLFNYLNVDEIIKRLIVPLIDVQNDLVNRAFINYFLLELNLDTHFHEMRKFFFFENGEFAALFLPQLCTRLFSNEYKIDRLDDVFNPMYINETFKKTLSTLKGINAHQWSIKINFKTFEEKRNAYKTSNLIASHYHAQLLDYLSCLELHYKVDWPLNLLITDASIKKYNIFFAFMIQLKFCLNALNTSLLDLKRIALMHNSVESTQMVHLRKLCYEMEQFLNGLQNYLFEVTNSSWHEFQENMNSKAHSLNDLRDIHNSYLNKTLFGSFFTEKTAKILKIIKSLLSCILLFRFQLQNDVWLYNSQTNQLECKSFQTLSETNNNFKELFKFLFSVLKFSVSKYEDLNLKYLEASLNFNCFY